MASSLAWSLPRQWSGLLMTETDARPLARLDDAALVAECVAGTPGAFDLVVERYRRSVYQICYRFVGNHEDASDLSQEVFLRAYRGLKNFRGQSALSTWLYRIAVNVSLNRVSLKTPPIEAIDNHDFADTRADSASDRILRSERNA